MKNPIKIMFCPSCGKFQGFIWFDKCLYNCSVCGREKERVRGKENYKPCSLQEKFDEWDRLLKELEGD